MSEYFDNLIAAIGLNWKYWGPDGLGWKSPSQAARHYEKAPEEYKWDQIAVADLEKKVRQIQFEAEQERVRDRTGGASSSSKMDPGLRRDIDEILRMDKEGMSSELIASVMELNVNGVRNVIRLNGRPLEADEMVGEQSPEVQRFIFRLKGFSS